MQRRHPTVVFTCSLFLATWACDRRAEFRAEEVVFIPCRALALLRHAIAQQKQQPRRIYSRVVVDRLFHVVQRRVVSRLEPFFSHFPSIGTITNQNGRDPLLNKRIVVGANEEVLLRHRVGRDSVTRELSCPDGILIEARMFSANRVEILAGIAHSGSDVGIDVGNEVLFRDHGEVSEIVGPLQVAFLPGGEEKDDRPTGRLGQFRVGSSDFQYGGYTRCVVQCSVADFVAPALNRRAHSQMIEMCAVNHVLRTEFRVGTLNFPDNIPAAEGLIRGHNMHLGGPAQGKCLGLAVALW